MFIALHVERVLLILPNSLWGVQMNHKGHAGLTLLILSPTFFLLNLKDFNSVATLIFAVGFSWLPDIDLDLEMKHRKYTHNILFAIIAGIMFGVLFNFAGLWLVGFMGAFLGTICHLLGDMLTYMPFNPLWPFREMEVALEKFESNDKIVNDGMMTIGSLAFLLYLLRYAGIL